MRVGELSGAVELFTNGKWIINMQAAEGDGKTESLIMLLAAKKLTARVVGACLIVEVDDSK